MKHEKPMPCDSSIPNFMTGADMEEGWLQEAAEEAAEEVVERFSSAKVIMDEDVKGR